MGVHRGARRVPLREAAQLLGVSKDAVRQRIRRGTIRSEKGEDGRVYVFVDASTDAAQPQADHAGHAYPQAEGGRRHADPAPLVEEMRGRIEDLREQLAAERRANEENRRIIAALTSRIPELPAPGQEEAPQGPPEAGETATPQPGRVGPQTAVTGPEEPTERPWWRRLFGQ